MKALQILLILSVGYLIGSVLSALVIGKLTNGVDVRKYGSGNPGTTNVLRTLGVLPAISVFFLDVFKGIVAVIFAKIVMQDDIVLAQTLGAVAVICGHTWPLYFNFKGGKAAATSWGAALAIHPTIAIAVLLFAVLVVAIKRYMSLGVMSGAFFYLIIVLIFAREYWFLALFILIVILIRHRENIKRLINGTERKVGERIRFK
ncbi:glycerol-3-phosphate 1-O-acyltransferase PlsY [Caldicellulosiruptoraceae bacterium PP1]